jgi:hypothetical protein
MNKDEKIKTLKNALNIFKEGKAGGLCICISYALCDHFDQERGLWDIKNNIPEFNWNNVTELARIHKFKKPLDKSFWWEYGELKDRARTIGALIKQIKEQDDTRKK